MAGGDATALLAHLKSGETTVCQCWAVTRRDGMSLGFTDHDRPLSFDGLEFRPDSGFSASVLAQTTGLAVDNREVLGALTDSAIAEEDVRAGRYDGAEVVSWLVDWTDPAARMIQFRGTLGEIREEGGVFRADLRGLAEMLNQPQGLVYQRPCSAALGDARCGVDLAQPGFFADLTVEEIRDARVLRFSGLGGFAAGWFARGRLRVTGGAGAGLLALVKADRSVGAVREIELWETLRVEILAGDPVRLEAGCDRRPETCRDKFGNFLNFRGFPHIPGDDWMTSYPRAGTKVEPNRTLSRLAGGT